MLLTVYTLECSHVRTFRRTLAAVVCVRIQLNCEPDTHLFWACPDRLCQRAYIHVMRIPTTLAAPVYALPKKN